MLSWYGILQIYLLDHEGMELGMKSLALETISFICTKGQEKQRYQHNSLIAKYGPEHLAADTWGNTSTVSELGQSRRVNWYVTEEDPARDNNTPHINNRREMPFEAVCRTPRGDLRRLEEGGAGTSSDPAT